MEKSFGLMFFLKKPRNYTEGPLPVYLRITVNGNARDLSIKRTADPSKWNAGAGRLMGKTDEAKALNGYLDTVQHKVFEARKKLLERDQEITAEALKNRILGREEQKPGYLLLAIFRYHNQQMAALVGREYSPGTMERYETSLKHTQSFLTWKYGVEDMDITRLDYEFLSEYAFWLKSVRRCGHNSTMKYLSNFRKIINQCLRKHTDIISSGAGGVLERAALDHSRGGQQRPQGGCTGRYGSNGYTWSNP